MKGKGGDGGGDAGSGCGTSGSGSGRHSSWGEEAANKSGTRQLGSPRNEIDLEREEKMRK